MDLCPSPAKDKRHHTMWRSPVRVGSILCTQRMPSDGLRVGRGIHGAIKSVSAWHCLCVIPRHSTSVRWHGREDRCLDDRPVETCCNFHGFVTISADRIALVLCCQRQDAFLEAFSHEARMDGRGNTQSLQEVILLERHGNKLRVSSVMLTVRPALE